MFADGVINIDIMMSYIEVSCENHRLILILQLREVILQIYIPLIHAVFEST